MTAHITEDLSIRDDRALTLQESSNGLEKYRMSTVTSASPGSDSSWLKAITGSNDLQIEIDRPATTGKVVASGSDKSQSFVTPGHTQFEQEKLDAKFEKIDDNTYSITDKDGTLYKVQFSDDPKSNRKFVTAVDATGKIVPEIDPVLKEEIAAQAESLKHKQEWADILEKTPLDAEQQKAVTELNAAIKANDFEAIKKISAQFSTDPSRFNKVFTHILGETVLTGDKMNLGWGYFLEENRGMLSVLPESRPYLYVKLG